MPLLDQSLHIVGEVTNTAQVLVDDDHRNIKACITHRDRCSQVSRLINKTFGIYQPVRGAIIIKKYFICISVMQNNTAQLIRS